MWFAMRRMKFMHGKRMQIGHHLQPSGLWCLQPCGARAHPVPIILSSEDGSQPSRMPPSGISMTRACRTASHA